MLSVEELRQTLAEFDPDQEYSDQEITAIRDATQALASVFVDSILHKDEQS